ncbi:hypothetical protein ACTPEU_00605, partial [Clostridioides difficile]|uniref:hypothetical protein n=1 Tax=Clostridioides difficile TaxID=1496 RepID=UPI003F8D45F5
MNKPPRHPDESILAGGTLKAVAIRGCIIGVADLVTASFLDSDTCFTFSNSTLVLFKLIPLSFSSFNSLSNKTN